jgi:GlpG protein
MRAIAHLPSEEMAKVFGDYLYVQGIENQVEHDSADGWTIWIVEEDKLETAKTLLEEFQRNPADPRFRTEGKSAAILRAEKEKTEEAYRRKLKDRRHLFRPLRGYRFGPLTLTLIVASVAVFLLSKFGTNKEAVRFLFITDFEASGNYVRWVAGLTEIRHGEIWRLFTPILVHFNILHILFNMMWLADLGSMVEGRQSTWYLGVLVLVLAAGSNLAQFFVSGPLFGGMSGVVYGLLGYVWLRGKFDPGSGLFVHPTTVTFMVIWFVAGLTGLLGSIANTAHAAGLLIGLAWGYLASIRYR